MTYFILLLIWVSILIAFGIWGARRARKAFGVERVKPYRDAWFYIFWFCLVISGALYTMAPEWYPYYTGYGRLTADPPWWYYGLIIGFFCAWLFGLMPPGNKGKYMG